MNRKIGKITIGKLLLVCILVLISCSKDSDLLNDLMYEKETSKEVEEQPNEDNDESSEDGDAEEEGGEEEQPKPDPEPKFETRTTEFPTLDDVYLESDKAHDYEIIRLDNDFRVSFLRFDLSGLDSISATIERVKLKFTIKNDEGNGTLNIHLANESNWSENDLEAASAPTPGKLLGSVVKDFELDVTEEIPLETSKIPSKDITLILEHKNGNDLALAAKEHPSNMGASLVVSYEVDIDAEEVTVPQPKDEEDEEGNENNESPMAITDASPLSGGAPLKVNFVGSGSSDDTGILSYHWDFKDGTTSTEVNPEHIFDSVGTYDVALTVTDEAGLTGTDMVTITVNEEQNQPPVASAQADKTEGVAPLTVAFTGHGSTDDTGITSYTWDFKDGTTSNSADHTHTFENPGTYDVTLTVKDENGLDDTKTITITVEAPTNEAPVAKANATPQSGEAPLTVQFTGTNSTDDKQVVSYYWDLPGDPSSAPNPKRTFNTPGTYEISLTVRDEEGASSTDTVTITVNASTNTNEAPNAIATADKTSGNAPLTVNFTGQNSTDDDEVSSYYWDFKDGNSSTTTNPSHTFNAPGTYNVSLTVKDKEGLTDTAVVTITVSQTTNDPNTYFVTTGGSSSNNGKSENAAWSLEHAFDVAKAGDIIYIKRGNYGNQNIEMRDRSNTSNDLIKFIGYSNTPGDVQSNQGSTFTYGNSVNGSTMPLLGSSSANGTAITIFESNVLLENIQFTGYNKGVLVHSIANGFRAKNLIMTSLGTQNNYHSYDGVGIDVRGNSAIIENCFVQNATSEAIKLIDSDYSRIANSSVYADNASNPTDYYFLLADGTNNTVVENCYAQRAQGLQHGGHGFMVKNNGTNNTFKNCVAQRTNFELNYHGVHHNTIDGGAVYGAGTGAGEWHARILINNGANNNLIKNIKVEDTWTAIVLSTYFDATGNDSSLGYDNRFENVTVNNAYNAIGVGGGGTNYTAKAQRYTFSNCNFKNFDVFVIAHLTGEQMVFQNSTISNGDTYLIEVGGEYEPYSSFDASYQNCSWTNNNFTPPN